MIALILFSAFTAFQNNSIAQEDEKYYELSIEDLLNIQVSVASKTEMTPRESPGIISIITEEEIQNSGARDLIDLLRMIPGFEFGSDVQGVVGLGLRGVWGHEGKILLMMDGLELNELSFSTTQYGNHYPVDQIKRIEIIRGPGSAIYGGFAELGVINIITRAGEDIKGVSASVTAGGMQNTFYRENLSVSIGKKISDDFSFSLHAFKGSGIRSTKNFLDNTGNSYNFKDQSDLDPNMFNTAITYKSLKMKFLYDHYQLLTRDMFGENFLSAYREHFKTIIGELTYDFKVTDKLTITPKYSYKETRPYQITADPVANENESFDISAHEDTRVIRHLANVTANYSANEKLNFLLGGEFFTDRAKTFLTDSSRFFYNGKDNVHFSNLCFFGQAYYKTDFVNITIGGRAENHSQTGPAIAPRISLTRAFPGFHYKLLFSQAFRSPSVKNIDYNAYFDTINNKPDIEEEKTSIIEIETGAKIGRNMYFTINAFQMKIKDVIVYFVDENTGSEGYKNGLQTGSRGVEMECRFNGKRGNVAANYSYYNVEGINKVDDYKVPDNKSVLLAFPQHKICLNSKINLTSQISTNISLSWLSEKYAFRVIDSVNTVYDTGNPVFLANIAVNYRNFLTEGLSLQLSAYDILNSDYVFVQPYVGGHNPLPSLGREFIIKLVYKM